MAPRDVLLALMLAAMWGSTFTAMKIGVVDEPPLLMNTLRFALSAFPAILFLPRPAVPFTLLAAFALILFAAKFSILFTSLAIGMPAGLASIVLQMQVFFTILFAFLFMGERPKRHQLIGAGVAFIGMAIFAAEKIQNAALLPFLLSLLAALLWGVANIIVKKAQAKNVLAFVVWASAIAAPVSLVLSLMVDGPARVMAVLSAPSFSTLWVTAYLAFGATLLGYWTWNGLISRYPIAQVGPFALLIPVSGMVCGYLFLGEILSWQAIIASTVVFCGLLINLFGDRVVLRMRNP